MTAQAFEVWSHEEIRLLQLERLQVALNRAYLNVDFYRRRMDRLGILPEEVTSLEALRSFPFTTSRDLADHYPYGLFAVPLRSVVRLKITPTADGRAIVVGFTRRDVMLWQSLMERLYRRLGIDEKDIVQVAFNYSLFPGAFTFNHATEQIGATLAPSATVSATLQLQILRDFRSTVLATTPSFALRIADVLKEGNGTQGGENPIHLKRLLLGPEPVPLAAREVLESVLGIPVYGLYGVSEMVEPGMAGECPERDGLHLAEDHFLAEIVHPQTGEAVPRGQEGELVVTTLSAEAYPLIRYRTGDITVLRESPCACGRTTQRIAPILRRVDDRLTVRGIPFYPQKVGDILRQLDPGECDYRLVVFRRYGVGEALELLIARSDTSPFTAGGKSAYLEAVRSHIRRVLGLGLRVRLVEPQRLPREGLVAKTVFAD